MINLVSSHTLTIKLIGQFLQTSGYDLYTLIDSLKQNKLSDIFNDDEVVHENKYKNINAHIKSLFSLAKLSKQEEIVLANLSLIPTSGIKKYIFRSWNDSSDTMTLVSKLVDKGFVESNHGLIYLHPLIQAVVKDTIHPTSELCANFLNCVMKNLEEEVIPTLRQMDELSLITLSIANGLNEENITMVKLLTAIGRFHNSYAYYKLMPLKNYKAMNTAFAQFKTDNIDKLKEFNVSYTLYTKAGKMLEKLGDIDDDTKERLYTRFAALLYNIKKYDEAIKYNELALEINNKLRGPVDENTITNKRRMGTCYFTKGDYQKAYEIYNDNLNTRLNNLPQSEENLGRSYMHVANALKNLNRFEEALSHYQKARNFALGVESASIGLAMMDEEIADLYNKMGNHEKVNEFLLEAIELYKKYSDNEEKIEELENRLK